MWCSLGQTKNALVNYKALKFLAEDIRGLYLICYMMSSMLKAWANIESSGSGNAVCDQILVI